MSKLIEFNSEDVQKGLLSQMESPYWGCERKKTTVSVFDVGDYSIFIKKNLEDAKGLLIKTKSSKWYEAKEIIPSPSGSVIYFNEQVGKIFKKGCIYPIVIVSPYVFSYKRILLAAEELYKAGHIETIGYGQTKILSP
jgi:hypothetical protein